MRPTVFLLSPASCTGRRAGWLLRVGATLPLAQALRSPEGAPLGDVFAFLSGLYFRGKLAYARAFARPPQGSLGVHVITASRGLVPPDARITLADLREFAEASIDPAAAAYRAPLEDSARRLARRAREAHAVLLGSIATDKYTSVLSAAFGDRLVFPAAFVGRGDMSRGGLLLRCVDAGEELHYLPLEGATRRGARPPRLPPRQRTKKPDPP